MINEVIHMTRSSRESLHTLAEFITDDLYKDSMVSEIIANDLSVDNGVENLLLIFEKYYFRNSSMATVVIRIISVDGVQKALIVGTGGGTGIFNTSWGANRNFALRVKDTLLRCGFDLVE